MPDGLYIPGGPLFGGTPNPPDVPCDPTGNGWRGPPGPQGPKGEPGVMADAPNDGQIYGRGGATPAWVPALPIAGGVMTGTLTLAGNATANLSPVTLQQMNAAVGAYMPIAGGHFTGPLTSTTTGSLPSAPENTPNMSFNSGRIIFNRQLSNATSPLPTYGGVNVYFTNNASTWVNEPWGGDAGASAFFVQAQTTATSNGSTVGIQANLITQGQHNYTSQDVGIASTVTRLGASSTWAISTQTQDNTGLAPGSFSAVGAEIDILANGPDNPVSLYDPHLSNRFMILLGMKANPTTTYAHSTHFGIGTIVVQTPSGGVATCYICTTAGTTGATGPIWPTSGTVTDGTVVWTTGTTQAPQLGCGIYLGTDMSLGPGVTINTGLGMGGQYNNACIDLTNATFADTTCAAIRIPENSVIDFTGGGSNANKNRRTLGYSDYFVGMTLTTWDGTTERVASFWGNDGSFQAANTCQFAGGSNLSGITTGYSTSNLTIGRNQQGNHNINFITGQNGLTLFSTDGSGNISTPYATFGGTSGATFNNANGAGTSYNWTQNVFGTAAAGQQANWGSYNIGSDTANAAAAQGGGATCMYFGNNISAGATGGRTGVTSFLNQAGATNLPNNLYYVSGASFAQAAYSAGGTSGAPQGNIFARNESVQLLSGATNWNVCTGSEITIGVSTGASVAYKGGFSIVQWASDAVQGSVEDFAMGVGIQNGGTAPGWKVGLQFGMRSGWWPFTASSTMIGTGPPVTGGPAIAASWGIDLSAVTFGGGLIRGPSFSVDGNGIVTAGGGTMNGGLHFGTSVVSSPTDLSRHIELYGGGYAGFSVANSNLNYVSGGAHGFFCGATQVGFINSAGLNSMAIGQQTPAAGTFSIVQVQSTSGPTWTSGSAAPVSTQPAGSLYSRTAGATGTRLYVSAGGGTWNAVAGV